MARRRRHHGFTIRKPRCPKELDLLSGAVLKKCRRSSSRRSEKGRLSRFDMKIAGIEALHLRVPQVELKADGTQEVLLVRVTTDDGIVGHGEAVSNASVARAIVEAPRSMPFRHGNGLSRLFMTIAAAFAELERDRIRERITQVKRDQKARHRLLGGMRAPFGFRAGADGALVPNASEQAAIASAMRMRGRGKNLRYIAGKLALDGHRLNPESVRRMLAR